MLFRFPTGNCKMTDWEGKKKIKPEHKFSFPVSEQYLNLGNLMELQKYLEIMNPCQIFVAYICTYTHILRVYELFVCIEMHDPLFSYLYFNRTNSNGIV